MSKGLLITEAMSGWIHLSQDKKRNFSFCIKAFNPKIINLTGLRVFKGTANIEGLGSYETTGTLTIHPSGPEYHFKIHTCEFGELEFIGKKTYQISRLIYSMTHCPLTVLQRGKTQGASLLAYRESILSFPFKALSLQEQPDWYDLVHASFR